MENEQNGQEITESIDSTAKDTVETIIQNGVSKEQLQEMLQEILGKQPASIDREQIEAAEQEYFSSHLKY